MTGQYAGRSIIEIMWEELDGIMDQIMDLRELDKQDLDPQWAKGRANGVAWCISVLQNPYVANVAQVRQIAKERWQQRQDGKPMTPLRTRP